MRSRCRTLQKKWLAHYGLAHLALSGVARALRCLYVHTDDASSPAERGWGERLALFYQFHSFFSSTDFVSSAQRSSCRPRPSPTSRLLQRSTLAPNAAYFSSSPTLTTNQCADNVAQDSLGPAGPEQLPPLTRGGACMPAGSSLPWSPPLCAPRRRFSSSASRLVRRQPPFASPSLVLRPSRRIHFTPPHLLSRQVTMRAWALSVR